MVSMWRELLVATVVALVSNVPLVSGFLQLDSCPEFQDLRSNSQENQFVYLIGPESAPYYQIIKPNESLLVECDTTVSRYVILNDDQNQTFISDPKRAPKYDERRFQQKFTESGDYFDGYHYFQKSEYCVKTITDSAIELQVCQPICNSKSATRHCIPKCCAPDQVFAYWSLRCIQLFPDEPRWNPVICEDEHCAQTKLEKSVHFHQHSVACKNHDSILRHSTQRMELFVPDVIHQIDEKQNIRIAYTHGHIGLQRLSSDRKWENYDVDFCADGFVKNKNDPYMGSIENQVFVTCKEDHPEEEILSHEVENWASITCQLIGTFLMLTTVLIYLVLMKHQNFNGLMILSYSAASLFSYIFSLVAHFIIVSPDAEAAGFSERGAFCMIIAIGAHLFYFVTFGWLTVMNYILWQTLKSLNPANTGGSKRLKTFVICSALAWGIPALLIGAFAVLDEVYRDPLTYIVVPDYAVESCSVAIWSRGYFIYIPTAIILGVNGLLTMLTLKVILEAKSNAAKMSKTGADRYTGKLFLKLFFLMGAVSFLTMLLWYFNGHTRPWYVSVFKTILQLDSIPLFILFSCNARTMNQLQDKFPCLEGFFNVFKKMKMPQFTTQTSIVD